MEEVRPQVTGYFCIGGTCWPDDTWWHPQSHLNQFLRARGLDHLGTIQWSGREVLNPRIQHDWQRGAENVMAALSNIPFAHRNLICHSHGGQLALIAAQTVPIRRLLTIATPNRMDVPHDRKLIERWRHVCATETDWWSQLGAIFDFRLSFRRQIKEADVNVCMPGIGHSRSLDHPAYLDRWVDDGLIDFLVT